MSVGIELQCFPKTFLVCHGLLLDALANIQALAGVSQPLVASEVVFLGCRETCMAHGVFYCNEVFPIAQHRGRKGSPEVVGSALFNTGLNSARVKDVVDSLA